MKLRLKHFRELKGYSQEHVYTNLCSKRHYSRIENNLCVPSALLIVSFSKRLNVPIEDLIQLDTHEATLINNLIHFNYHY